MKWTSLFVAMAAILVPASSMAQLTPPPATGAILGTGLNVSDYARSLKYYTEGVGMTVLASIGTDEHRETFLTFGREPGKPMLMLLSGQEASAAAATHPAAFGRIVITVGDAVAVQARLRAAGFTAGDVQTIAGGRQVLIVHDPDGYRLEFVAKPAAKP